MTHGLGYLVDKPDDRDKDISLLLGTSDEEPPDHWMENNHLVDGIEGQTGEACVGFSSSKGVQTRWNIIAGEVGASMPSPGFVWFNSRKQHGAELRNSGTYIRLALREMNKIGICPEDKWPNSKLKLDYGVQPDARAYRAAFDQKTPIGYYRVAGLASHRIRAMKQALWKGHPFVFGTSVDRAFLEAKDHVVLDIPEGKLIGGHAMLATGYDEIGVYGPNSWTKNWGNSGWFGLTWDYMTWVQTRDIWAIDAPPRFSE